MRTFDHRKATETTNALWLGKPSSHEGSEREVCDLFTHNNFRTETVLFFSFIFTDHCRNIAAVVSNLKIKGTIGSNFSAPAKVQISRIFIFVERNFATIRQFKQ